MRRFWANEQEAGLAGSISTPSSPKQQLKKVLFEDSLEIPKAHYIRSINRYPSVA